MNYSVFLGPDQRHIPDGKWDEFKAQGLLTLYDLVFRHVDPKDGDYIPVLTRGSGDIRLGRVMRDRMGEWAAIPNPSHLDKTIVDGIQIAVRRYSQRGFATRLRAAEYLMRVQGFTDPMDW